MPVDISTLPSYATVPAYASSIINRFDISDNLAKSVVFNLSENKWISDYQFMGEQYEYFDNVRACMSQSCVFE